MPRRIVLCCSQGLAAPRQGFTLPDFLGREPCQRLVWPDDVVERTKRVQLSLQAVCAAKPDLADRAFQSPEQPLNTPVAPRLARRPAPTGDGQRLQRRGHKRAVNIASLSVRMASGRPCSERQEQMTEQGEGTLGWQDLQATEFARPRIDDAQHREGEPVRRLEERQV